MNIDPTKAHEVLQHKHDRPLIACRFDPTGRYVFFGAEDNLVHRFEIQTRSVSEGNVQGNVSEGNKAQSLTPLAAHDSWVRALGFSPDGKTLYTGGYDGRLIFWPAADEKPTPIRTIDAHNGWLRALSVSHDGSRIATCGNDNLVKLWEAATGKQFAECAGHTSHVYNVAFNPTGESLVSCDLKGALKQWDASTGSLHHDLTPATALYKYDTTFRADIGGARSIAFSPDGKRLALGGITNVTNAFAGIGHALVVLIDRDSGKVALQLEAKDKVNGVAWGLARHPGVAGGHASDDSASDMASFWICLTGGGGGGWLYFFKDTAEPDSGGNALHGAPQSSASADAAKDAEKKPDASKDAVRTVNEFFKLKLASDGRDLALSPDKTQLAVAHADKTLRLYAMHAAL